MMECEEEEEILAHLSDFGARSDSDIVENMIAGFAPPRDFETEVDSLILSGSVIAEVSVFPTSIRFPNSFPGMSTTQRIILANNGVIDERFKLSLTGDDGFIINESGIVVSPGGTSAVNVSFVPGHVSLFQASLIIEGRTSIVIPLTGHCVPSALELPPLDSPHWEFPKLSGDRLIPIINRAFFLSLAVDFSSDSKAVIVSPVHMDLAPRTRQDLKLIMNPDILEHDETPSITVVSPKTGEHFSIALCRSGPKPCSILDFGTVSIRTPVDKTLRLAYPKVCPNVAWPFSVTNRDPNGIQQNSFIFRFCANKSGKFCFRLSFEEFDIELVATAVDTPYKIRTSSKGFGAFVLKNISEEPITLSLAIFPPSCILDVTEASLRPREAMKVHIVGDLRGERRLLVTWNDREGRTIQDRIVLGGGGGDDTEVSVNELGIRSESGIGAVSDSFGGGKVVEKDEGLLRKSGNSGGEVIEKVTVKSGEFGERKGKSDSGSIRREQLSPSNLRFGESLSSPLNDDNRRKQSSRFTVRNTLESSSNGAESERHISKTERKEKENSSEKKRKTQNSFSDEESSEEKVMDKSKTERKENSSQRKRKTQNSFSGEERSKTERKVNIVERNLLGSSSSFSDEERSKTEPKENTSERKKTKTHNSFSEEETEKPKTEQKDPTDSIETTKNRNFNKEQPNPFEKGERPPTFDDRKYSTKRRKTTIPILPKIHQKFGSNSQIGFSPATLEFQKTGIPHTLLILNPSVRSIMITTEFNASLLTVSPLSQLLDPKSQLKLAVTSLEAVDSLLKVFAEDDCYEIPVKYVKNFVDNDIFDVDFRVLEFGSVEIGVASLKSLCITNLSATLVSLTVALPKRSAFHALHRVLLQPNESGELEVEFAPNRAKSFCEVLRLDSGRAQIDIKVKGEGVMFLEEGEREVQLEKRLVFPKCGKGVMRRGKVRIINRSAELVELKAFTVAPFFCPIAEFRVESGCFLLVPVHFVAMREGEYCERLEFLSSSRKQLVVVLEGVCGGDDEESFV
jgi:hypothetical protein